LQPCVFNGQQGGRFLKNALGRTAQWQFCFFFQFYLDAVLAANFFEELDGTRAVVLGTILFFWLFSPFSCSREHRWTTVSGPIRAA
jgi:hypothetical protein